MKKFLVSIYRIASDYRFRKRIVSIEANSVTEVDREVKKIYREWTISQIVEA